jgi:ammonium transporter, Amt family
MEEKPDHRPRILIVDDTPANIDVLGTMLMDYYDIQVALDGKTALKIAGSDEPPDLILLDVMMPEMDGYTVAGHLKSSPATRHIPIIFVTAKIEEQDEAMGFEAGGVDYIRKPFHSTVTLARIRSQLELKLYRDRLSETLRQSRASARQHQIFFNELFMNSPYGIILVDTNDRITHANNSFNELLGYSRDDVKDKQFCSLCESTDQVQTHLQLFRQALAGGTVSMETRCRHRKGYHIPVSALAYPVKINDRIQGVFIFYENISQRKSFEEKLKHQAYHDALTRIPNRLYFRERLDQALKVQSADPGKRFAVMLIDLDRFKSVNDSLGHQAGDELLKAVVVRIQQCLRTRDTLARLGGDEFAILLQEIRCDKEVSAIATRIHNAIEMNFVIQNRTVHISASIGIVMDTGRYPTGDQLLRDADLAMYHAKDAGKARFKFFTPRMHDDLMASVTIEADLRKALENRELHLYYQPILTVTDQQVSGFEALVRWDHPDRGLVPPDRFIPVAEETGLMVSMGAWIIETACRHLAILNQNRDRPFTMHINVSVKQFVQDDFVTHLCRTVDDCATDATLIRLEFTESLLMEASLATTKKLEQLKQKGFILSIDDFGTGYSSLSYLQQFPIDQIKIDRSFIDAMGRQEESFEIVKSLLGLSRILDLSNVAEGVETQSQLDMLRELGCQTAQGYLFSRPLPWEELQTYLQALDRPEVFQTPKPCTAIDSGRQHIDDR